MWSIFSFNFSIRSITRTKFVTSKKCNRPNLIENASQLIRGWNRLIFATNLFHCDRERTRRGNCDKKKNKSRRKSNGLRLQALPKSDTDNKSSPLQCRLDLLKNVFPSIYVRVILEKEGTTKKSRRVESGLKAFRHREEQNAKRCIIKSLWEREECVGVCPWHGPCLWFQSRVDVRSLAKNKVYRVGKWSERRN